MDDLRHCVAQPADRRRFESEVGAPDVSLEERRTRRPLGGDPPAISNEKDEPALGSGCSQRSRKVPPDQARRTRQKERSVGQSVPSRQAAADPASIGTKV